MMNMIEIESVNSVQTTEEQSVDSVTWYVTI